MAEDHVTRAARRHGVPEGRLRAMRRVESGGNAAAVSRRGARGEFQVMPETAKELGYTAEDMHDPEKSADAAARYTRKLYDRFGDWDTAVEAYNAGAARVAHRKKKGIPLPAETRHYLRKIKAVEAAGTLLDREEKGS